MANNRLIIGISLFLLFIIVVLFISYFSYHIDADDFAVPREYKISQIKMTDKGSEKTVLLTRQEKDNWTLNNQMSANLPAVDELVSMIHRLSVEKPVSVKQQAESRKKILSNGIETKVFIRAHVINTGAINWISYHKHVSTIFVGKQSTDDGHALMVKEGKQMVYEVFVPGFEGDLASLFDTSQRIWMNPVVLDVKRHQLKEVSLTFHRKPNESFILKKTGNEEFTFFKPETGTIIEFEPDSAKLDRFTRSFEDIHYERLLDPKEESVRKEIMIPDTLITLKVEDISGNIRKFEIFERKNPQQQQHLLEGDIDPDRFYVLMENGEFARAQYFVFDRILRPLSFFQNK